MIEDKVLDIPLNVPDSFLWIVFLIALIIFGGFSWILVHHWGYYGVKGNKKVFAKSLYFIGGIIFIILAIIFIGAYGIL